MRNEEKSSWSRPVLNLRMSKSRAKQLAALRDRMKATASPTDVVDHALDRALREDIGLVRRIEELELASATSSADCANEIAELRQSIASLVESIGALHALISQVADGE